MKPDPVLRQVLDLVLRQRHDPSHQFVFVSSPPGGGKTQLVEVVAVAARQLGLQVVIACPRAEQAFALVRRLRHSSRAQRLQLLVGKDRPLPADLQGQAIPLGGGCFDVGPSHGTPVAVGTVAKLGLLAASRAVTCDLLILDEAYQVTLAEFAPLLPCADRFLLIGDPGQLPPLVLIDPEPFAAARFRVHEPVAQELLRHRPTAPHLRLRQTHRLPPDTVPFLQPHYADLPFRASASAVRRRLRFAHPGQQKDAVDRALDLLASGASLVVLELPARTGGGSPSIPRWPRSWQKSRSECWSAGLPRSEERPSRPGDVGIADPHVGSGEAIRRELEARHLPGGSPLVGTPEVWQGLERPLMIVHHPLSGADPASRFSLDPGRSCVALSRHQFGCVLVTRAGVEHVLRAALPVSGVHPLGSPDRGWQGLQFHRHIWLELKRRRRIVRV